MLCPFTLPVSPTFSNWSRRPFRLVWCLTDICRQKMGEKTDLWWPSLQSLMSSFYTYSRLSRTNKASGISSACFSPGKQTEHFPNRIHFQRLQRLNITFGEFVSLFSEKWLTDQLQLSQIALSLARVLILCLSTWEHHKLARHGHRAKALGSRLARVPWASFRLSSEATCAWSNELCSQPSQNSKEITHICARPRLSPPPPKGILPPCGLWWGHTCVHT